MNIAKEEVMHIAGLARLKLNDAELDKMTTQLDTILSYMAKLDELDTTGISPTTHALATVNAFREDEEKPSLSVDNAIMNAPVHNDSFFIVPKII
jgi:aspartyl-tRNA(Asn)/glutamyl-tRNA(Gln) amidotransferase subunit C